MLDCGTCTCLIDSHVPACGLHQTRVKGVCLGLYACHLSASHRQASVCFIVLIDRVPKIRGYPIASVQESLSYRNLEITFQCLLPSVQSEMVQSDDYHVVYQINWRRDDNVVSSRTMTISPGERGLVAFIRLLELFSKDENAMLGFHVSE